MNTSTLPRSANAPLPPGCPAVNAPQAFPHLRHSGNGHPRIRPHSQAAAPIAERRTKGNRHPPPESGVPDHPAGIDAPIAERPQHEFAEEVLPHFPYDPHPEPQRGEVRSAERRRAAQRESAPASQNLPTEDRQAFHAIQDQVRIQLAHGDDVEGPQGFTSYPLPARKGNPAIW